MHRFDFLPTRSAGAAENMATDFMLLQRYPSPEYIRFRSYGWHRPAFTFGYSQKIAEVRAQLPGDEPVELCRRATGGGLVGHRRDWTYALVIPRGHPIEELRASESYRLVHTALQAALAKLDFATALQPAGEAENDGGIARVCFARAEPADLIDENTRRKVAGAAQKRNKHGLLLQGSLWRPALPREFDGEALAEAFAGELQKNFYAEISSTSWPDWSDDELSALTEKYTSPEWNEFR